MSVSPVPYLNGISLTGLLGGSTDLTEASTFALMVTARTATWLNTQSGRSSHQRSSSQLGALDKSRLRRPTGRRMTKPPTTRLTPRTSKSCR